MAAVVLDFDDGLAAGKTDNCFGCRIHTGAAKLREADISQAAQKGGNGKVVSNHQGVFGSGNDIRKRRPGSLL